MLNSVLLSGNDVTAFSFTFFGELTVGVFDNDSNRSSFLSMFMLCCNSCCKCLIVFMYGLQSSDIPSEELSLLQDR